MPRLKELIEGIRYLEPSEDYAQPASLFSGE